MTVRPGRLDRAARALLPYLAIAGGLLAVYEPVLRSDALFNDDYVNFVEPPSWRWQLGGVGRPVQHLLLGWAQRLVAEDAAQLLTLRLVLFALCGALAMALYRAVRDGLRPWNAVALVLFVFALPTFVITFGWLSVAVNAPAYLAAAASYATGYLLLGRTERPLVRLALALATVLLVALAALTYQVAVALPLALVVYHLLHEARERGAFRDAAVLYALVFAGVALSYVVLRVLLREAQLPMEGRVQGAASRLASARALGLPFRIFTANFALHYYYWGWLTREAAMLVGGVLTAVVARAIWRDVRAPAAGRDGWIRWALVAAAFAAAAMLFALDASRELRSKPFLTLLVLFVVLHAVRSAPGWARLRPKRALTWGVVALTLASGRHALAEGLVGYADAELAHVRDALARAPSPVRRVHVVQPENACFSPPCYGWYEFHLKLASTQVYVPRGMVRFALARLGRAAEVVETTFSPGAPEDATAVVVDLRPLGRRLRAERGEVVDLEAFLKRGLRPADVAGLSGLWLRLRDQSPAERPTP